MLSKIADDWIRTWVFWIQKQLICQQRNCYCFPQWVKCLNCYMFCNLFNVLYFWQLVAFWINEAVALDDAKTRHSHVQPVKGDVCLDPGLLVDERSDLLHPDLLLLSAHPLVGVGHVEQVNTHFCKLKINKFNV